jgi:predicted CXXCH cytochrome family protein
VALWMVLLFLVADCAALCQTTSVRDFDAGCARCHSGIYRSYLNTPMANASGPARDKPISGTFVHSSSGLNYDVSFSREQATLAIQDSRKPGTTEQRSLSYFLGSGHLGTTYLYSIDKFLFESPVAWYAASNGYDMKPGLAEMKQAPPSIPMQSSCLRCHMSAVQPSDAGTINRFQGLPFLHTGITCEACHGDSQEHAAEDRKAPIVNPAKLTADQRDSICISCHLEGDVSVERAGHSMLDYRPGEPISTYLAFYVYKSADPLVRGVSEVEQFSQSICKRISGDKMSCTSCHDPHFTPPANERTAFYRAKCLACHSQPAFASTHHPENQDCTSCHMSRTGAENIPHVAWTDHRILRLPEKSWPATQPQKLSEFEPIFSPTATRRDLAMAYYKAMLEGDPSLEPNASKQMQQLQSEILNDSTSSAPMSHDKDALDAVGVMNAEQGNGQVAEQAFRKVLELDPHDLIALSNLGTLQAKQGNLKEALTLLQTAFERNQDVSGLAMNLARVECIAGDAASARATLNATLLYNPGLRKVRDMLTQLSNCSDANGKR